MGYQGIERRRHRVYVTRNTEYHLRDGVCVAVRDKGERVFRPGHLALDRRIEGGLRISPNGTRVPCLSTPEVGDAIFFAVKDGRGYARQLVTSRIEKILRPPKTDVMLYPPGPSDKR